MTEAETEHPLDGRADRVQLAIEDVEYFTTVEGWHGGTDGIR